MNLTKFNAREKLEYMAERAALDAKHEADLRAKDEIIDYYRRAAENATKSKRRALGHMSEQRKDIVAWGVLLAGAGAFLLLAAEAIVVFAAGL